MTLQRERLGSAMASEIDETPAVLEELSRHRGDWAPGLRHRLAGLRGVALTARGSSDHAGAYGRYLLEQVLGVPAWSTAPSLVTRYGATTDNSGLLAIGISQSGRTPEIVSVLEHSRSTGAITIAITNDEASPLAAAGDIVVGLHAGPERAVPSTKTFTASLAALAMLAAELDPTDRFTYDAAGVGESITSAIEDADSTSGVDRAVDILIDADVAVHLGRGYLLPLAREGALKMIESVRFANLAWSPTDFLHGPFALVRPGLPVIVHHAPGPVAADAQAVSARLVDAGATVIAVGEPLAGAAAVIAIAGDLPEHLRPLVHAVRVQQLALRLAQARSIDPDGPPGLAKITSTA